MGLKCSQTVRFVSLRQLHLIVFAIRYANAVEQFVLSMKMNENMAKKKVGKLGHYNLMIQATTRPRKNMLKAVTEASGNWWDMGKEMRYFVKNRNRA